MTELRVVLLLRPSKDKYVINHVDAPVLSSQNACHLLLEVLWCQRKSKRQTAEAEAAKGSDESGVLLTFLDKLYLLKSKNSVQLGEHPLFTQKSENLVHSREHVPFSEDDLVELRKDSAGVVTSRSLHSVQLFLHTMGSGLQPDE